MQRLRGSAYRVSEPSSFGAGTLGILRPQRPGLRSRWSSAGIGLPHTPTPQPQLSFWKRPGALIAEARGGQNGAGLFSSARPAGRAYSVLHAGNLAGRALLRLVSYSRSPEVTEPRRSLHVRDDGRPGASRLLGLATQRRVCFPRRRQNSNIPLLQPREDLKSTLVHRFRP